MPKTEIDDEVRAAIDRDPRIPHTGEVAVFERDGVVTLRGSVGSFRQRRSADRQLGAGRARRRGRAQNRPAGPLRG